MVINTLQDDARYTQRHINTLQYDARTHSVTLTHCTMTHGTHNVTLTHCNMMHGTHNVTLTHCSMMHRTHNVKLRRQNELLLLVWKNLAYKLELCRPNKNFHYFYSPQQTIFFISPTLRQSEKYNCHFTNVLTILLLQYSYNRDTRHGKTTVSEISMSLCLHF